MATRTQALSTLHFTPTPMQPTPISRPFHIEGWVYEAKVDGWRMLAFKISATVKLISRQGIDHTSRFPELAAAGAALPYESVVLDGEVAVFDQVLVSRFEWLRGVTPVRSPRRRSSWRSMRC